MRRYSIPVSCPWCAAELDHVTSSRVYPGDRCAPDRAISQASAVAKCSGCSAEFQLCAALLPVRGYDAVRKARSRATTG